MKTLSTKSKKTVLKTGNVFTKEKKKKLRNAYICKQDDLNDATKDKVQATTRKKISKQNKQKLKDDKNMTRKYRNIPSIFFYSLAACNKKLKKIYLHEEMGFIFKTSNPISKQGLSILKKNGIKKGSKFYCFKAKIIINMNRVSLLPPKEKEEYQEKLNKLIKKKQDRYIQKIKNKIGVDNQKCIQALTAIANVCHDILHLNRKLTKEEVSHYLSKLVKLEQVKGKKQIQLNLLQIDKLFVIKLLCIQKSIWDLLSSEPIRPGLEVMGLQYIKEEETNTINSKRRFQIFSSGRTQRDPSSSISVS